jgi:hypothetical protein
MQWSAVIDTASLPWIPLCLSEVSLPHIQPLSCSHLTSVSVVYLFQNALWVSGLLALPLGLVLPVAVGCGSRAFCPRLADCSLCGSTTGSSVHQAQVSSNILMYFHGLLLICVLVYVYISVFFLEIMGFELRASCLLGRPSTTWATPPALLLH